MIRLFLLGFKGFYLIRNLPIQYLTKIGSVVIAKDHAIQNDYYEEIKQECIVKQLTFYERNTEPIPNERYLIMIGWRWLVQDFSSRELIVFHDSLLPRYRGFNPLVTALINGDSIIGATCLFGSEEYDKGDIIDQESIDIVYPLKIQDAIRLISELYLKLFLRLLNQIDKGVIKRYIQNNMDASYSLWRNEDDYFINWNWDAQKIERFVDAVGFPYQGARARINDKIVLLPNVKADLHDVSIENRDTGKVIFKKDQKLFIVCGSGLIIVKEIYFNDGSIFNLKDIFRIRFT